MSDLNPEDIPNSEVSDISESELTKEESNINTNEQTSDMQNKIDV